MGGTPLTGDPDLFAEGLPDLAVDLDEPRLQAYRLDLHGGVVAKAPPGCEELTWNASSGTLDEFDADRYLLVYDKVDHFLIANNGVVRLTSDFLRFLEVKLPAV